MTKKIVLLLTLISFGVFAVPTVIDTVTVPINLIKFVSITGGVPYYAGTIDYNLHVGDNDSLNISLAFVPAGTGAAVTVDSMRGDAGIKSVVNGINGLNKINFWCHITGTPAATYTAQVTINAGLSYVESTTDNLVNTMTPTQQANELYSNGTRQSANVTVGGTCVPGYYMSNGTAAACWGTAAGSNAKSTSFPQGCAMTCTFDTGLMSRVGVALAQEFYAENNYMLEGPMINLVRDPRGGRNWEDFGEDPYLAARMAVSYCNGAQSLNCVVIGKHWVCNDRENNRFTGSTTNYNAVVPERTLREIYCMPFEYIVKEGKAWGMMSAENQVDGQECTANTHVLTDILKTDWGFRGFVVSDWNAIVDADYTAANAGEDIQLPNADKFSQLPADVTAGRVTAARLADMAKRIVRTKVWAGVLNKCGNVTKYTADLMDQANSNLALEVAQKSIVVVKNANFGTPAAPALPLDPTQTVAVVGSYYNQCRQWAQGSSTSSGQNCPATANEVTPDAGISARAGSKYVGQTTTNASIVVVVCGVSGDGENQDRTTLTIDNANDNALVTSAKTAGKKCVVVLTGGAAALPEAWANADAIVVAWFPGQAQGTALAQILYGDINPSGRLSASWPAAAAQLPAWASTPQTFNYEGPDTGRGYRYYDRTSQVPQYPFGYGLSYTTFTYSNLTVSPSPAYAGQDVVVSVDIQNAGTRTGDEIAQLYLQENNAAAAGHPRPVKELRGFVRVTLTAGQKKTVSFTLREREFAYFNTTSGKFVAAPGAYTVLVGPQSYAGQPVSSFPVSGTLTLQ
jgi:beta-glucosidase